MAELTPSPVSELALAVIPPLDRHPVAVYLASLAPGSRRTVQQSLDTIAGMLSGGELDAFGLDWSAIRYPHAAAVRAQLAAAYKPATANKMLSALRQALHDRAGEAVTRHALAMVYEALGEPERAIAAYETTLWLRQQLDDRPGEALTCYNLARMYERLGYLREAEALLSRAVDLEALFHHPNVAADEAALVALRARRRGAGLPPPEDTTGSFPRLRPEDLR